VLSRASVVETIDEGALSLLALPRDQCLGRQLLELVVVQTLEDAAAAQRPEPTTFSALSKETATALLVHVTSVGEHRVATLTCVNEYLAASQSLARVQLRNTVESIIAGFAHEVRNPLAAILSLTEAAMVQDQPPDSPLVRVPSLIARVESLIKQSLSYSRPKPPRRELHQVGALIHQATGLLRKREQRAELVVPHAAADFPPVMVDLHQAEQVLVNLIENALDSARGRVEVSVRGAKANAPAVCVEVVDDGPGVPPEVIERIFEPFFTTKAHGTGLGLAIARDLARLNGGELRVRNDPGGGARFQLFLPSTEAALRGPW